MSFVNLFSQYIKKVANETDTDYADVLKSFEKSKRLQNDWKAYRDAEMKKKPFLFKPPVIERIIHFENVSPLVENLTIPLPTEDTSIKVIKDEDSIIVQEDDLGGVEESKGEDTDRLQELVENLVINNDLSNPSQLIRPPYKSDKPAKKTNKEKQDEFEEDIEKIFKIKPKKSKKKTIKQEEIEGEGLEDYLPVRRNYPPKSREVLYWKGNEIIKDMRIVRTELSPAVFNSVNLLTEFTTGGKFQERFRQMPYDKLYHLALVVTTMKGSVIKMEKNEVLNIEENPTISPDAEIKKITTNLPTDLTIATMLYNAQSRMGDKYFVYNAHTNNCQDWILNILDANNIGDEKDRQFIKQDITELFRGFEGTSNFLSLLTSIASIANRLIYGNGIGKAIADKDYTIQTIIFEKQKWNTKTADKWLKKNKYKNKGVDEKENSLRYRQIDPAYIERKGFDKYATKKLGKSGISIVLAYKKNK